jgi:hypothetical protein
VLLQQQFVPHVVGIKLCRGETLAGLGNDGDVYGRHTLPGGVVWLLIIFLVLWVKAQDLWIGRWRRFARRVFLEDAALESLECGFPWEVWWSLSGMVPSARLV